MNARRIDFTVGLHGGTSRDYLARVTQSDKAEVAAIAQQWGFDYWDGDRRYGYGGYRYDGRWRPVAEAIATRYGLAAGSRVLDVGCGKAHLLYELTQVVPGLDVRGLDISAYALEHAKDEVRDRLDLGDASALPYAADSFDLVLSLATLHNLGVAGLWKALGEIDRVARDGRAYVMVESYRNEREKVNLLYWQLTCRSFYAVEDWEWIFERAGYRGEYGFIFFE